QAPRAWYARLSSKLLDYGFLNSKSDTSLFIFNSRGVRLYVLVYVDDILITGSSQAAVSSLIQFLNVEFAVKDLGPLHFFLGI
ncbi:hypothetical protein FGF92_24340, partial [Salmonella sp. gx-f5]|nr:hypothetical protein [Salmonella sp. gx-f5]